MPLFSEHPFMPHGHCFLWRGDILALHVISDAVIALSYYSIPVVLYLFAKRRPDFKYRTLLFMFALFIVGCGTTHMMAIWNFWNAHYWLSGTVKALTALVSAATAVVIWPLLPQLLKIPNPAELESARSRLTDLKQSLLRIIHRRSETADPEIGVVEQSVKEYIEDLRQSQLALQTVNFAQVRFLTNMSHELRTPLGSISGYVDRLRVEEEVPARYREILDRIKASSDHLSGLLNDILDISKIEAGKLDIDPEETPLRKLLVNIGSVITGQLKRGVAFSTVLESELPGSLEVDPLRLKQILINLLNNAAKFTDDGSIEMRVRYDRRDAVSGELVIQVADTGIGIPREKFEHLFKPFAQVDDSLTRRSAGTGLGLVLSRQLANLMDGDLELVTSESGKGSIFRLSLTVPHPEGAGSFSTLADGTAERKAEDLSVAMLEGRLRDRRILLVEDGVDNQNVVSYFLKIAGAEVDIAENGAAGVEKARAGRYDLVLMDIQMPVMDGYAALKALQSGGYEAPIIALTAHAMREERSKCLEAGFSDYLPKPIDVLKMVTTIERMLNSVSV